MSLLETEEVPFLDELHRKAAPSRVASYAHAIDAAANNKHVEDLGHGGSATQRRASRLGRAL
jgi:hypothetical protein